MAPREKKEMKEEDEEEEEQPSYWGTLEELLLACAVNRHGPDNWDLISGELLQRTSPDRHHHYAPSNCRRRYTHLLRLFADADVVAELRRLRIEELRSQVQRHDGNIEVMTSNVERLKRERDEAKDLSTEPENKNQDGPLPDESVSGSGDRSLNGSNSTTNQKDEPDAKTGEPEPEPVKPVEDKPVVPVEEEKDRNSVDESSKKSSEINGEVKMRRRGRGKFEIASSEEEVDGDEVPLAAKQIAIKCEPLIKVLTTLRSHKSGSIFERRLKSQETEKYKKMIRQHIDLQIVQKKLDKGVYLNSRSKFFRDLLLLFANALIYFPNNSNEHSSASELRKLIITEMVETIAKPEENKDKSKPVPAKPVRDPSPPPIVVCTRRKAIGLKPAPSAVAKSTKEAEAKTRVKNPRFDAKAKERVIVKKPAVNARNGKSNNNTKKVPMKELESSSDDESDDEEEEEEEPIVRGRNSRKMSGGKKAADRRETGRKRGRDAGNTELGKRGRPGKETPPVIAGGRGGKRGRGGAAVVVEDAGRGRKRPRR